MRSHVYSRVATHVCAVDVTPTPHATPHAHEHDAPREHGTEPNHTHTKTVLGIGFCLRQLSHIFARPQIVVHVLSVRSPSASPGSGVGPSVQSVHPLSLASRLPAHLRSLRAALCLWVLSREVALVPSPKLVPNNTPLGTDRRCPSRLTSPLVPSSPRLLTPLLLALW